MHLQKISKDLYSALLREDDNSTISSQKILRKAFASTTASGKWTINFYSTYRSAGQEQTSSPDFCSKQDFSEHWITSAMAFSTPVLKTCNEGDSPVSFINLPQGRTALPVKLISDGSFSNDRMGTCAHSARNCDVSMVKKAQAAKVNNTTKNF